MTLTVKHDLLTDLLFSVLGKRKTQTPVQALASSITSDTNLRNRLTKAMQSNSFADMAWLAHALDDSDDPTVEEFLDRMSEKFHLFYEILLADPTHYATSFGNWLVKGILSGIKDSFTDCEKPDPMYLLVDYLDSIVGYVSDSSSQSEYEFRGDKYTDNLFNYIVVLAEYRHFLYGGELDELVDTRFISLWIPDNGRNGSLIPTRYKLLNALYATHAPRFKVEHASNSRNPEYQQKKDNVGPKVLHSGNAGNSVEKISPTPLMRHLGITAAAEHEMERSLLPFVLCLLERVDKIQRYAITEGYSANEIIEGFDELPEMQQEFRDHLIAYSQQPECKDSIAEVLRQRQ